MQQKKFRTQYVVPDSGESWNSENGAVADNTAPDTVLSPDDPFYELATGKIKQAEHYD